MLAVLVAGARPNFMKLKPVADSLERHGAEICIIHTGQHFDSCMSDVFFDELGLRSPDHALGTGAGSHAEQTSRVMLALEPLLHRLHPDVVVVVGDVNSTLAAALVAAKATVPLAHVEAGLRSGDWSMPEEINRIVTDRLSAFLFAPSDDAVANLLAEGAEADRIYMVGNVMVDTLLSNIGRAKNRPILDTLGLKPSGFALVTLHRPSNVDEPAVLGRLLRMLSSLSSQCPVVFPAHPRTRAMLDGVSVPSGIHVIEPLGYLDFLALEASARIVLTDSGGIQEETTVLGVPCLTLRETTERPVTVSEGTNVVVGTDPDHIVAEARRVLAQGVNGTIPRLWDGKAAERIAEILASSII